MMNAETIKTCRWALLLAEESYLNGLIIEEPPVIRKRIDAALADLDTERWQPVEGEIPDDDTLYIKDGNLYALTEIGEMTVSFPHGYAVCRLAGEASHE